jgi:hypothetical protein
MITMSTSLLHLYMLPIIVAVLSGNIMHFTFTIGQQLTASYDPVLPVAVTVTPSSGLLVAPVAGGSFTLTCGHDSTASAPTYFDDHDVDVVILCTSLSQLDRVGC